MANITAKEVAALRERTGSGMMDCKKALVEADGDQEKAIVILREKGLAAVAKKAGRIAAEGLVISKTSGNIGVVLEINSETDFVAKNDDFRSFVETVADTIIEKNPTDVDALKECVASGSNVTVNELLIEKISTIGENIQIRRFVRREGVLVSYVHGEGKIGVLVELDTDLSADNADVNACGKDVALQITALNPLYLGKEDIPDEAIENEKEVQKQIAIKEGKPENIAMKIVQGRMSKFYNEVCLLEQSFVKDDEITVGKYIASVASKLGGKLSVKGFTRYEKGEGLQKREDNFADEVAGMIK